MSGKEESHKLQKGSNVFVGPLVLFRAFVNRWEFLFWLPPGMCSKRKSYRHGEMEPCCAPAPHDSSGAKLNQDSLKCHKVKEAVLCVLNPSESLDHENSSEFPRNTHVGQSLDRAGGSTRNKGQRIIECERLGMALKDHPVHGQGHLPLNHVAQDLIQLVPQSLNSSLEEPCCLCRWPSTLSWQRMSKGTSLPRLELSMALQQSLRSCVFISEIQEPEISQLCFWVSE